MIDKYDSHVPYVKTYVACLFFANMLFWFPCVISGAIIAKLTYISQRTGIMTSQVVANLVVGYFIFRGVIRNDLNSQKTHSPENREMPDGANKD